MSDEDWMTPKCTCTRCLQERADKRRTFVRGGLLFLMALLVFLAVAYGL